MSFDFTSRGLMDIRHLRFQRVWLCIGILLLLLVLVGSVIPIPAPVRSIMLHDKVAHTLAYAGLMGWFAQIFRHDLTRLILVVGLVMMGVGIEFLQGMTGSRQFDVLDMVANTSGVVLAWGLAYTWVGNTLVWVEGVFCRTILRA
ncbi:MAG: VanZ family protein [Granulosicoccus sp.]|nr:VanZ family protein [Granulosicoccus sp.]